MNRISQINNTAIIDTELRLSLFDMFYPIGCLYWSSKETNPSELFGGTWKQIKDKFILAAGDTYTSESMGGNANITLTESNLPSHSHTCSTEGNHSHTCSTEGNHSHSTNSLSTTSTGNTQPSFKGNEATGRFITITGKGRNSSAYYNGTYANGVFSWGGDMSDCIDKDTSWGISGSQINFSMTPSGTVDSHSHSMEHTHGTDIQGNHSHSIGQSGNHSHSIGNTGSGTAFSIMPPYIVKYCWERIG